VLIVNVAVNLTRLSRLTIQNLGEAQEGSGVCKYQVIESGLNRERSVHVFHRRTDGWKNLVFRALMLLNDIELGEEKKLKQTNKQTNTTKERKTQNDQTRNQP